MDVKNFLERAMHLDVLINSHVEELDNYRKLSMKISSSRLEEHVSHSAPTEAPYVKWVERIVDKEREINEEIDRLVDIKMETSKFIDKVDNPEWQYILRSRYIMGCTWEQIAKGIDCSVSTVKRSHQKALEKLEKIEI
ncbi:MAG: sigma-70 family RNA polymerase sigma factor [Selenomonadaceae bacterium]|nr:sigma-70 family RNA polymerase sigma factor [Selenomonadaceae bacterium]